MMIPILTIWIIHHWIPNQQYQEVAPPSHPPPPSNQTQSPQIINLIITDQQQQQQTQLEDSFPFIKPICATDELGSCFSLSPLTHPDLLSMYKQHVASFWTADKTNLLVDIWLGRETKRRKTAFRLHGFAGRWQSPKHDTSTASKWPYNPSPRNLLFADWHVHIQPQQSNRIFQYTHDDTKCAEEDRVGQAVYYKWGTVCCAVGGVCGGLIFLLTASFQKRWLNFPACLIVTNVMYCYI